MGWKGESRRHSLSRKGIKTNIDDHKRLSVRNFVARGYEGFEDIIHSQEYEGLDGYYFIKIFKDGRYELQTPSGLDLGKFDAEGYSHRAKYQEPDIEEWINSIGTDLVNNEGITFKAEGEHQKVETVHEDQLKETEHYKVGNFHWVVDGNSVVVTKDTPTGIENVGIYSYKNFEQAGENAYNMALKQANAKTIKDNKPILNHIRTKRNGTNIYAIEKTSKFGNKYVVEYYERLFPEHIFVSVDGKEVLSIDDIILNSDQKKVS